MKSEIYTRTSKSSDMLLEPKGPCTSLMLCSWSGKTGKDPKLSPSAGTETPWKQEVNAKVELEPVWLNIQVQTHSSLRKSGSSFWIQAFVEISV